jgi:mRNA deadenylase 3'-5' endonuclease subunit Ccr4
VVSWNLLAHHLARPEQRPRENLSWEHRLAGFRAALGHLRADVLCLQEVGSKEQAEYERVLGDMGYDGTVMTRGRAKTGKDSMANAVFFLRDRLRLEWTAGTSRVQCVGLASVCSEAPPRRVNIVNVHLEGHPAKHRERLAQLVSALRIASEHGSPKHVPAVLTGDFNSELRGVLADFLLSGVVPAGTPIEDTDTFCDKELRHDLGLRSAYPRIANAMPTYVGSRVDIAAIDHVLYTAASVVCTGYMETAKPDSLRSHLETGLPSTAHPSDHLLIGATFRFVPQQNS